ncbi:ABC transporter ATP-binding protein [Litoribrevibacter albus]|uniref:ABC transporter ATP-binding protein n=1 Tax=Litoribrevibacter albus TaxID=1473156 RepID=A0AA37SA64_9GAMM|nr:ABC transporter ATP-binding protein [Litoribrevibacter albus]GLQ32152.1 ABC transporter ATP-binding protein [Litoribrevibacter albus]
MLRRFEKIIDPFPVEEPEQPPASLYQFCRHHIKGMEIPLIAMAVLSAILAILEVYLFGFMGDLIDWLSTETPATLFENHGDELLGVGLLLMVGLPILVFLHAAILHLALLGNFPMQIRWMSHRYLLKQSMSFYQNDFAGRIATKVMQTSLAVRETVMKLLDVMVYVGVYAVAILVLVAQADYRMMLPLLTWVICYSLILYFFIPRLKRISTKQADARAEMTGRVVDSYTNIATVKLFSHSQREASYAKEGMAAFLQTVYTQMRYATGLSFSVDVINYILIFAMAFIGIWLWSGELITAGAIAVAVSLALRLNGMSQWIMWEISALFENIGTVADGMNTLSQPQEVLDVPEAKPLQVTHGEIQFDHIEFHYGKKSGVIDDLTLNIKPGEKVGLVGRSGAGKSTLVNSLLRFHDLASGRILIDGQDISEVQQESLRAQIGMVTQDTSLLHRSVRENILYGHPTATEQEMIQATLQAEADEFIQTLSDLEGRVGYDAKVGERGVKLSGGQRQRIAIARVLLKDAPILVLDEATSALDSEVEASIQKSLIKLMENKTVIAIAHRLSTIAAMDRLIVMDKGAIVEQGTHQELVEKGGIYAQLWAHQTGGFIGEA